MATQQGMSSIDLRAMLNEMKIRLPLWIGKIYQYNTDSFGFRLNGEDKAKYNFIVECGKRAHLSGELPEAPSNPSGYSMFLRKYISGGIILDIRQYGLQRIFIITIGKSDRRYNLIFELFNEGNAILCDEDFIVINPLMRQNFRDREIVNGKEYVFPGFGSDITPEIAEEILNESDKDLVRTLASGFMLGGRYAEEICRTTGLDKKTDAQSTDPEIISSSINELISREINAVITESGCWPFSMMDEEPISSFNSYNEALSDYYPLPKSTD